MVSRIVLSICSLVLGISALDEMPVSFPLYGFTRCLAQVGSSRISRDTRGQPNHGSITSLRPLEYDYSNLGARGFDLCRRGIDILYPRYKCGEVTLVFTTVKLT